MTILQDSERMREGERMIVLEPQVYFDRLYDGFNDMSTLADGFVGWIFYGNSIAVFE